MENQQTLEFIMALAWGTPFGLGFMVITLGIFLWLLGKFIVSLSEAVKNLKK